MEQSLKAELDLIPSPEWISLRQAVLWVAGGYRPLSLEYEAVQNYPENINFMDRTKVDEACRYIFFKCRVGSIRSRWKITEDKHSIELIAMDGFERFLYKNIDFQESCAEFFDKNLELWDVLFIEVSTQDLIREIPSSVGQVAGALSPCCDATSSPVPPPAYSTKLLKVLDAVRGKIADSGNLDTWTREAIKAECAAILPSGGSDREKNAIATILLPDEKRGK